MDNKNDKNESKRNYGQNKPEELEIEDLTFDDVEFNASIDGQANLQPSKENAVSEPEQSENALSSSDPASTDKLPNEQVTDTGDASEELGLQDDKSDDVPSNQEDSNADQGESEKQDAGEKNNNSSKEDDHQGGKEPKKDRQPEGKGDDKEPKPNEKPKEPADENKPPEKNGGADKKENKEPTSNDQSKNPSNNEKSKPQQEKPNKDPKNNDNKEGLNKKREQVKNNSNRRQPSGNKSAGSKPSLKDRIKKAPSNMANKAKNNAASKVKQKTEKAKAAVDKAKNTIKVVSKLVSNPAFWYTVGIIALVIGIVYLILLITGVGTSPGVGGDVNEEETNSNFSKEDQETLEKIKKLFEKYPNSDGTLAMATVLYPYFTSLHGGNVNAIMSSSDSETVEEAPEGDEATTEPDDDNSDVVDDETDATPDDPYLLPLRRYKLRTKMKRLLKELNGSNQDAFADYLRKKYFKNDNGYGSFEKDKLDGYNGYKEMLDSVKSDERDALAEAIIEDLYEKKDWFVDYVYQTLLCSVSYNSAGTTEIDELLKANILIDVKEESCYSGKNVQNCSSKYSQPITLDKYVMGVAYEEIGVSSSTDIEKLKAQMIAAKSYVVSRWKTMGWKVSKTEDGTYVLPIRSNTNDQDYCDVDTGCQDKLVGAKRDPIDDATRELMTSAWEDTKNTFIYDKNNNRTAGEFCQSRSGVCDFCNKGSCLAHEELSGYQSGTSYTSIIGEQYSNYALIELEGEFASVSVPGAVTCTSGAASAGGIPDNLFTYYYQTDYPDSPFCNSTDWKNGCSGIGKNSICTSGCGVTSLAMVVSSLSDEVITPIQASEEGAARGGCATGQGTYGSLFTGMSTSHPGFEVESVPVDKAGAAAILTAIKKGGVAVANVQSLSPFTNGGHWIVIRGISNNGEVKIADPNSKEITTTKTYNIYDFIDKNWMVDSGGTTHGWFIIYGPKSPMYASKVSATGDAGVATGYLGNPTDPNNTTKSYFGEGNTKSFPRYSGGSCHGGIDLPMSIKTPIYAMDGGTVSTTNDYSGNCYNVNCGGGNNSFGNLVVIEHGNGYLTRYAHLSQRLVNVGDVVAKGQLIGYSGNTGNSSGPHLHLELEKTDLLNQYGRNAAKCNVGQGLINASLYINSETSYVGQTN